MIPHCLGCPCVVCPAEVQEPRLSFAEAVERYRTAAAQCNSAWKEVLRLGREQQAAVDQLYDELGGEG